MKGKGGQRNRRPWILANFALSADGKISTREYAPTGFTSPRDKKLLQEIRAQGDALMVGRRTLETDRMSMTISREDLQESRLARGQARYPWRIVLTSLSRISPTWKIFQREGGPVLLVTQEVAEKAKCPDGVEGEVYARKPLRLGDFMGWLWREKGVRILVCEGGPTLLRQLLEEDLLDELYLTVAPVLFGGEGAPTLTGLDGRFLTVNFRLLGTELVEGEVFCHFQRRGRVRQKHQQICPG